jgi:hypothetical protein
VLNQARLTRAAIKALGGQFEQLLNPEAEEFFSQTNSTSDSNSCYDSQSFGSHNTSLLTLRSTQHSRKRVDSRDINNRRLLQAAIKHGVKRPNTQGRDGWIFEFVGITHVTDKSTTRTITAFVTDDEV